MSDYQFDFMDLDAQKRMLLIRRRDYLRSLEMAYIRSLPKTSSRRRTLMEKWTKDGLKDDSPKKLQVKPASNPSTESDRASNTNVDDSAKSTNSKSNPHFKSTNVDCTEFSNEASSSEESNESDVKVIGVKKKGVIDTSSSETSDDSKVQVLQAKKKPPANTVRRGRSSGRTNVKVARYTPDSPSGKNKSSVPKDDLRNVKCNVGGLLPCHALTLQDQEGLQYVHHPDESTPRLPFMVLVPHSPEESSLTLEHCKVFVHFMRYNAPLDSYTYPHTWMNLVQSLALKPDADLNDFKTPIQETFGIFGQLVPDSDTDVAVNCLANVLRNVNPQVIQNLDSALGRRAVSDLKCSFLQIMGYHFMSVMAEHRYMDVNKIEALHVEFAELSSSGKSHPTNVAQYILGKNYDDVKVVMEQVTTRQVFCALERFPASATGVDWTKECETMSWMDHCLENMYQHCLTDWEDLDITITPNVRDQFIGDFRDSPTIPDSYYENSQANSVAKSPPPKKKQRTSRSKSTASKSTAPKSTASKSASAKSASAKEEITSAKSSNAQVNVSAKSSNAQVNVAKKKRGVKIKADQIPSSGLKLKHLFDNVHSGPQQGRVVCLRNVTFLPEPTIVQSAIMREKFEAAKVYPELGCCMVDFMGKFQVLMTDGDCKKHARELLDSIGKESRKNSNGEPHALKRFTGKKNPDNKIAAYLNYSPKRLSDCHEKSLHLYDAVTQDPDTKKATHAVVLHLESPLSQLHCCTLHPDGCGKTLKVGDVVKVDGASPVHLVNGKAWMFNVNRFNAQNMAIKCGVGVMKVMATQANIIANRIAIVTGVHEHVPSEMKTSTVEHTCCYATVTFLDGKTHVRGTLFVGLGLRESDSDSS